jgi:integrase
MNRVLMTPDWLKQILADAAAGRITRGEWADADQRSLKLRLRRGGLFWSTRYLSGGRYVRYKLGQFPDVKLAAARKAASGVRGVAAIGQDLQVKKREVRQAAKKRRLGETIKKAVGTWLADKKRGPVAAWKDGLEGGAARSFMPHIRALQASDLGKRRVDEVTAKELEQFRLEPEAPATRNRRRTVLRKFFKWAQRTGLVQSMPGAEMEKETEGERDRRLTDEELGALVRGFDATRWGRAVRLLVLTLQRREEIMGLRWKWLDLDHGVATLPRTFDKAGAFRGEPREIPLSHQAVALIKEQREANFAEGHGGAELVFVTSTGARAHPDTLKPILNVLCGFRPNGTMSTDKRAKKRVAVIPEDIRLHDIRRTGADALIRRLGTPPWVVNHVILGHVRTKIERTYMPVLPLDEARAALERWGEDLERIMGRSRAEQRA